MKRFLKSSMILAVMAVVLSSCNCYKKMAKNSEAIDAAATPELLMLKGQNIATDLKVTFPAEYFNKKATLKITPVLVFEGGEIEGTPKFVQGENVKDNYTVIPYSTGGSYTQSVAFPYDARARKATLVLHVDARCKTGDFMPMTDITVAEGVSMIQASSDWTSGMAIMPDNFKRVTTITQDATIQYLVNSSAVRSNEIGKESINLLREFVKENSAKDRVTLGNFYAKGYASPEGPENVNDKLSKDRSNSGKAAVAKKINMKDLNYDVAAYGEDWEGFKKLVEASNIKDKDLILQVLNMYSSSTQRDREIKNMSQVYDVLKKDILPELRRTQLIAEANIQGKTDEELKAAVASNINDLNVEEMLFSATLFDDEATKAKIYKAAADKYNDVRAFNNYGVVMAAQGDLDAAKKAFNRAASLKSAPEISNNLGVAALIEGNVADAKKYISSLNIKEAAQSKALVAMAEGNYNTAVKSLDGYNLAVAEFCNGNLSKAKSALANVNTAKGDYLKAVIAMREGNSAAATSNLKSAFAKDSSLKEYAKNDVEFAKIADAIASL